MNTKRFYFRGVGFVLSLWLALGQTLANTGTPMYVGRLAINWLADSDADGVDDAHDLCPGTPAGITVNAYGCPVSLTTCDYTTSTVTLKNTGGSSGSAITTKYVLADNAGTILQISSTASFSGLTGTATYMALALTYDTGVSNLSVGNTLSAVSGSCFDWSDALVFKACVNSPSTCDYQIGDRIALQSAGGSSGTGVKTSYVLTDAAGKLLAISTAPTFSTTGLSAGTYQAYALTYNDDNSIAHLLVDGTTTLYQVTANCLVKSSGLTLKLCIPATSCDYQIGDYINLQSAGGSSGAGIKTSYVLTDATGKLVRINTKPSFSTSGLSVGTYQAYSLTYNDDNSITHLVVDGATTLSQVTANCLVESPGLTLKLCLICKTKCIPILITRLR